MYKWMAERVPGINITYIPGNSAVFVPFFGMVSYLRDPNSKAMLVTNPTFGDKVWSRIESPGWLFSGFERQGIRDEISCPIYMGRSFVKHEIRIPSLNTQDFMESKAISSM